MVARLVGSLLLVGSLGGCATEADQGPPVGRQRLALRDLGSVEAEFLALLNAHRMENGLAPVESDRILNQGAFDYSRVMGEQDHFEHTGPDGSSFDERMCEAGYEPACGPRTAVAENIAAGQRTASEVFQSWRSSPGHNANMLDPDFRVVGIGRAEVSGARFGVYWTNTFGGTRTDETVALDAPEGGGGDAGAASGGAMTGGRSGGCAVGGAPGSAPLGGLLVAAWGLRAARRRRRGR